MSTKTPKQKKRVKAASAATVSSAPTITLKHSSYQPTRAELEEDMTIDASPEEIMRSVVRLRKIKFEK